jgi:secreted Zn-dependent insulinase-like peptidase
MKNFLKDKVTVKGNLFAGLTGGSLFSFFFLFLNLPLTVSMPASIVSYIAGLMIFAKANKDYNLNFDVSSGEGKRSKEILQEFLKRINDLKFHASSIKNAKIKQKEERKANAVKEAAQRRQSMLERRQTIHEQKMGHMEDRLRRKEAIKAELRASRNAATSQNGLNSAQASK